MRKKQKKIIITTVIIALLLGAVAIFFALNQKQETGAILPGSYYESMNSLLSNAVIEKGEKLNITNEATAFYWNVGEPDKLGIIFIWYYIDDELVDATGPHSLRFERYGRWKNKDFISTEGLSDGKHKLTIKFTSTSLSTAKNYGYSASLCTDLSEWKNAHCGTWTKCYDMPTNRIYFLNGCSPSNAKILKIAGCDYLESKVGSGGWSEVDYYILTRDCTGPDIDIAKHDDFSDKMDIKTTFNKLFYIETTPIYIEVDCEQYGCSEGYTCRELVDGKHVCEKTEYIHITCEEKGCPTDYHCENQVCMPDKEPFSTFFLIIIVIVGLIALFLVGIGIIYLINEK